MSDDQHDSPIKTPRQLITIVVLAFVIPIALIILVAQLVTSGEKGLKDSDTAVLERIIPVGQVVIAAPTDRRDSSPGSRCSTRSARIATRPASPARPSSATRPRGRK